MRRTVYVTVKHPPIRPINRQQQRRAASLLLSALPLRAVADPEVCAGGAKRGFVHPAGVQGQCPR